MAICYILHSKKINKFYIGYTSEILDRRIEKHNTSYYGNKKYTHGTDDWELYYRIECESKAQAFRIEQHIKKYEE